MKKFLVQLFFVSLLAITFKACGGGGYSPASTPTTTQMGGSRHVVPLNLTTAVTTLAGTALSSGSIDAAGSAARFDYPFSITTDGTNLYVADNYNHTIRKIQ